MVPEKRRYIHVGVQTKTYPQSKCIIKVTCGFHGSHFNFFFFFFFCKTSVTIPFNLPNMPIMTSWPLSLVPTASLFNQCSTVP